MSMYDKYNGPVTSDDEFAGAECMHVTGEKQSELDLNRRINIYCGQPASSTCDSCLREMCHDHINICEKCGMHLCPNCVRYKHYCRGGIFSEGLYDNYEGPIRSDDEFDEGEECAICGGEAQYTCHICDGACCLGHARSCMECMEDTCMDCLEETDDGPVCHKCLDGLA